jgi:drug/metabolite transporter (DMT)-like permease
MTQERPSGIKVLTAFLILAGLAFILGGYVLEGLVVFPVAYCLWSMRKWGWYIVTGFYAIGVIMNLIEIFQNPVPTAAIMGTFVSILILKYIWSKRELYGV